MKRGIAHARAGEYSTAMKLYEQALQVDPTHKDAFVARYLDIHMLCDCCNIDQRCGVC